METLIPNSNITIKEDCYLITYCPCGNSYGSRVMILTYDLKATLKKYKALGYYVFGSAMLYSNGLFFGLTKSFQIKSRMHRQIIVGNAMYHIQKYSDEGKLSAEA